MKNEDYNYDENGKEIFAVSKTEQYFKNNNLKVEEQSSSTARQKEEKKNMYLDLIRPMSVLGEKYKNYKRDYILRGLPVGAIGCCIGTGGAGKGHFIMNMIKDPTNILNCDEEGNTLNSRSVLFANFEDDEAEIGMRFGETESFHSGDNMEAIGHSLFWGPKDNLKLNDELFEAFKNYDLVIIDTWALASAGVDENSNDDVSSAMKLLKGFAHQNKIAIILCHHTNKSAMSNGTGDDGSKNAADHGQSRGASALTDNSRLAITISAANEVQDENGYMRQSAQSLISKANYTASGDIQIYMRKEKGRFEVLVEEDE